MLILGHNSNVNFNCPNNAVWKYFYIFPGQKIYTAGIRNLFCRSYFMPRNWKVLQTKSGAIPPKDEEGDTFTADTWQEVFNLCCNNFSSLNQSLWFRKFWIAIEKTFLKIYTSPLSDMRFSSYYKILKKHVATHTFWVASGGTRLTEKKNEKLSVGNGFLRSQSRTPPSTHQNELWYWYPF